MACVITLIIIIISLLAGLFLFLRPAAAIEIQRRFYERINWRIEPISMEKEIRNTRVMGLLLISAILAAALYSAIKCRP